jgi:hypothetical protein
MKEWALPENNVAIYNISLIENICPSMSHF